MTADTIGQEKLDIAKVIQTTFQVFGRKFPLLAGLSALLSLAPSLVMLVLAIPFFQGFVETPTRPMPLSLLPLFGLASPILLVVAAIHQAATLHVAVSEISGRSSSFREALIVGVRNCLPVLGVLILSILAIGCGFVLLIVPGVMIAIAFSVAVPACVAERIGVFSAFTRSRALTRNNRWRIFGLIMIYVIVSWVFQMVLAALTGGFMPPAIGSSLFLARMAVSVIVSFFTTILTAVGTAALYGELRRLKEGVAPADLAAVFD